jgi:dTDP-4-dehydrorhamnose 3,5-epimerase
MKVMPTHISDVLIIQPQVYQDARGFFIETYQQQRYEQFGLELEFVQDNHSRSRHKTLRGLHYQTQHPQGKLCRVVRGEVYDVAVDLRRDSPTFGQWVGVFLSERNHLQMYVPPGCAHGFCVVSRAAEFLYKCTDYYHPEFEQTLLWNDPDLAIRWPIRDPLLSDKDRQGMLLRDAPCYELATV